MVYYPGPASGTPPHKPHFFPNLCSVKKGIQFIHRSTTLLAISWAVDGVEQQLFDPFHSKSPCASIGYLGLAL